MRRTRIVATIGPASDSDEVLKQLVDAGVDVFRLSFAHGDIASGIERLRRVRAIAPDLAIMVDIPGPKIRAGSFGTTPVVQKAKQSAIPSLYFTNLISARPLMGVAGAGSLAKVINAALGNQTRFNEMKAFFAGVGEGHAAGVWEDVPRDRPEFKKKQRAKTAQKPAEEMGAC